MNRPLAEGTSRQPTENNSMRLRDQDDPEFEVLGAAVRVGVLIWSAAILTLNYVSIPGLPQNKTDPTFIASVFTGALATFGIQRSTNSPSSSSRRPPSYPPEQPAAPRAPARARPTAPRKSKAASEE